MSRKRKRKHQIGGILERPPEEIAAVLRLEKGLGFLLRLLDTRVLTLYEKLTGQNEITPRQFGVLLTLHQRGRLTLTELAKHIRVDRSTLGEMITRMADRSLVSKRGSGNDRRFAEVSITPTGVDALLRVTKGAAELQNALLAPLQAQDRAHFMRCMQLITEPPPPERKSNDE